MPCRTFPATPAPCESKTPPKPVEVDLGEWKGEGIQSEGRMDMVLVHPVEDHAEMLEMHTLKNETVSMWSLELNITKADQPTVAEGLLARLLR